MASFRFFLFALLCLGSERIAFSQQELPPELKNVGIVDRLGNSIDLKEAVFKDEKGESVHLEKFFHKKKPVFFVFAYYQCPSLCTLVLNEFVFQLKELQWTAGKEFEVVTLSINPKEGPELAAQKKKAYLESYGRPEAENGWHFLTGQDADIKKIADQMGFKYEYDAKSGEYSHGAGIFALTPDGRISRILYGIQYTAKDMKLALLEASKGTIGTIIDRIILFCYRYDPSSRGYSLVANRIMKVGAGSTVILFGGYLFVFWGRQRRLSRVTSKKDKENLT